MKKYLSRRSRPLRKFPLARVDRYGSPIPREDKEWVRDLYQSIFSLHFAARGDRKRTRAGKTRPARQLSRAPISLFLSRFHPISRISSIFQRGVDTIHALGSIWRAACTRLDVTLRRIDDKNRKIGLIERHR